jgi:hypothetical protein
VFQSFISGDSSPFLTNSEGVEPENPIESIFFLKSVLMQVAAKNSFTPANEDVRYNRPNDKIETESEYDQSENRRQ